MPIPAHLSNFAALRLSAGPFVDKTGLIPALESGPAGHPFLLFLRPPGFGKSLLSSLLEHYYDAALSKDFDRLFKGLDIHASPTPLRAAFRVLYIDLSPVEAATGPDAAIAAMEGAVRASVASLLKRHGGALAEDPGLLREMASGKEPAALLSTLFLAAAEGPPLYVLLDAFEGAADPPGPQADALAPHVSALFGALKAGTRLGSVQRILVTGTTPLPPETLGLGLDILVPVSESPSLMTLCGWTRDETRALIQSLDLGAPADQEALLDGLEARFGGYRFRPGEGPALLNPRGVLRALQALGDRGELPEDPRDLGLSRPAPGPARRDDGGPTPRGMIARLTTLMSGEGLPTPVGTAGWLGHAYHRGIVTRGARAEGLEVYRLPNRGAALAAGERLLGLLAQETGACPDPIALAEGVSRLAYRGELAPLVALARPLLKAILQGEVLALTPLSLGVLIGALVDSAGVLRGEVLPGGARGERSILRLTPRRGAGDARFGWVLAPRYLPAGATGGQLEETLEEAEATGLAYLKTHGARSDGIGALRWKAAALVVVGAGACHWQVAGAHGVVQGG